MNKTQHFVASRNGDTNREIDAETGALRSCPIAEDVVRGKPDLCCCYILDQNGEFISPCHIPFESLCC